MTVLPTFYRLDCRLSVSDIELEKFTAAAGILNQTQSLLRRRIIRDIIDNDTEPHPSKFHTDRPTDSAASTGHKSIFRHKIFKIRSCFDLFV